MDSSNLLVFGGILLVVGLVVLVLRRSWGGSSARPAMPLAVTEVFDAESNPWLVRIELADSLRSAEHSLRRGDKLAQRLVRSDGQLYFSFEYIADEGERRRSVDLMRRIQTQQAVEPWEALKLIKQMYLD